MHPDVAKAWQAAARTFESLGATVEAVRLPDWYFDLSRPAGTIIASEAYLAASRLDRGQVQGDRPRRARRAPCAAKSFLPGAYAEELRAMAERRREFTEWMRALRRDPAADHGACPAIPLAEVDETSPIPGYLTRPGQLSRPVRPRHAEPACPAACRSASRSSASRSPSATC